MKPRPSVRSAVCCLHLGVTFVMKLDQEPDPHADGPITQLMASLMELIQQ